MTDSDQNWYVRSRGRILGPFSLSQMEGLLSQGRLAKFDEVSQDRRTWVRAASVPELYPTLQPPGPAEANKQAPVETKPAYDVLGSEPPVRASDSPSTVKVGAGPAWYYMGEQGQLCPVSLPELIGMARTGSIGPDTYVWTAEMKDWAPARTVAALGWSRAEINAAPSVTSGSGTGSSESRAPKLASMTIWGFILGLMGLLSGTLAFVTSVMLSAGTRNHDLLMYIFLVLVVTWGVSALLAVILGPLGMAQVSRSGGTLKGSGLGLTGLILGIIGLVGLLVMAFIVAIGVVAFSATK